MKKYYLHIGLGDLYNLNDFLKINKNRQYRDMAQHISMHNGEYIEFWACDSKWYDRYQLHVISNSDWIDQFVNQSICDDWDGAPLFDYWDCTSVMEHVKKDEVELFIDKLVEKLAPDSVGYLHIDTSNHGYSDAAVRASKEYTDKHDGKYKMYLNGISNEQWIELFSKRFNYSKIKVKQGSVTFESVKLNDTN